MIRVAGFNRPFPITNVFENEDVMEIMFALGRSQNPFDTVLKKLGYEAAFSLAPIPDKVSQSLQNDFEESFERKDPTNCLVDFYTDKERIYAYAMTLCYVRALTFACRHTLLFPTDLYYIMSFTNPYSTCEWMMTNFSLNTKDDSDYDASRLFFFFSVKYITTSRFENNNGARNYVSELDFTSFKEKEWRHKKFTDLKLKTGENILHLCNAFFDCVVEYVSFESARWKGRFVHRELPEHKHYVISKNHEKFFDWVHRKKNKEIQNAVRTFSKCTTTKFKSCHMYSFGKVFLWCLLVKRVALGTIEDAKTNTAISFIEHTEPTENITQLNTSVETQGIPYFSDNEEYAKFLGRETPTKKQRLGGDLY